MNNFFKVLVSLSFSGSVLILFFSILKPLIKNHVSRQWQYYIWLLVILRLLLPVTGQISLTDTLFSKFDKPPETTQNTAEPYTKENFGIIASPEESGPAAGITEYQNNPDILQPGFKSDPFRLLWNHLWSQVWILWLFTAAILLIKKIINYHNCTKYILKGSEEVSEIPIVNEFTQLKEGLGIYRVIGLYTNPSVGSPMILGLFRPCIILPDLNVSKEEFKLTILHELIHYKRKDLFYKWLVQLTICLHWFNPLLYRMSREVNQACELSCDEAVIKNLDAKQKCVYGDILMKTMASANHISTPLTSLSLARSAVLLKERLGAIMKFKKKSKLCITFTVLLTIAMCISTSAIGAYTVRSFHTDSDPLPVKVANLLGLNLKEKVQASKESKKKAVSAKEKLKMVNMDIKNCNIVIQPSEDDEIHYEYNKEYFTITSNYVKAEKQTKISISTVKGKEKEASEWNDFIKFYLPDTIIKQLAITGESAGIGVKNLNTNIDLDSKNSASSISVPPKFTKTIHFSLINGSGSLLVPEQNTNYFLEASIKKCAFSVDGFPKYDYDSSSYSYRNGNGKAAIELTIEDSAFSIYKQKADKK